MGYRMYLLAGCACLAPLQIQAQESLEETAVAFGTRPSVLSISLSPSGEKIAYISPIAASTEGVFVVDLANGDGTPELIEYYDDIGSELNYCNFATEDRLVCQIYGVTRPDNVLLYFTRMFSLSTDGEEFEVLTADDSYRQYGVQQSGGSVLALDVEGEEDRIVMTRQFVPQRSTGSRAVRNANERGLGVEMVDITNARRRTIEDPLPENGSFVADEHGQVRLKVMYETLRGQMTGETKYYYRPLDSNGWVEMSRSFPEFVPVAVDSALNVAYGFEEVDGYEALFALMLDGSDERQLILSRDDVDVDSLVRIGRQRRVVGASYATEKRMVAYLDPELDALADQLRSALPGNLSIGFAGASADESKLLVIASSDVDPGMVYLFDRSAGQISEVLPLRDILEGREMSPMEPVTFPAADGTQIPGYLTKPIGAEGPMPAIVLPHGGPGARDEWGFDWLVQFFTARGYAVLQPNFRGSAGYGSDWFGRNGFQAWETAIGDVNDAGRWLIEQGIADPEHMGIVGWSYGGYAALQSQVLDPELYKAVVAIAPVTDLDDLVQQSRFYSNFNIVEEFVGEGEHVRAGSPAQNAERFQSPVLLFHGTHDLNVNVRQSQLMERRLQDAGKSVQYVEYEQRDHQIDETWARSNMLMTIGTFLEENLLDR